MPVLTPTFEPAETLPHALRQRAEQAGDRLLLRDIRGQSRTYRQFYDASIRWANAFQAIGVGSGDNVAVMARTSIANFEHWLGLGWLRAIHTGVNTDFRTDSLVYVLNNSRARHMICAAEFLDRVAEVAATLTHLETVLVTDAESVTLPSDFPVRLVPADRLWDSAEPDGYFSTPQRHEIAAITYTSGTTGASKGILLPWGRMWPEVTWLDTTAEDIFYDPFPSFHLSGLLPLAWMAFAGGQVVLRDSFKTDQFWPDVREFGCTITCLIPAMMTWLLDQPPRPDDSDNPLRHVAGAPVISRIDEFRERFGVRMQTVYSSGETGMPLYAGPDITADPASQAMWVVDGYEARVVDEHDYPVPAGESGELVLRTEQPWRMFAGYFGMPEKTAETWRNGWFHTGDRVMADAQGRFVFVDRITDSMRRRGENISAMEVEAYVNQHQAVAESAAIPVRSTDGEDEVKICVIVRRGASVTPEALHEFLSARMPAFMVPRYIELIENPERTEAMKRIKKAPLRVRPLNEHTWDAVAHDADRAPRGGRRDVDAASTA